MPDTLSFAPKIIDYNQFPTLAAASLSNAYAKVVIGPAGSAKTTWMFQYVLQQAVLQAPGEDKVRRTRVVVVRNTYELLMNTTLKSAEVAYGNIAHWIYSTPPKGKIDVPLADGTRLYMEIEFLAMDKEDSLPKLLGREMTWLILDELSELDEKVFWAGNRRIGRYPSGALGSPTNMGIVGATNGPRKNHWLYSWSLGAKSVEFKAMSERMKRPFFQLFQQPPALLRPKDPLDAQDPNKWLINPVAENVENLPGKYEYYYKMLTEGLKEGDASIKAYVEGKFSDIRIGKPVFPEFSPQFHVLDEKFFNVPEGAHLGLSFDFGRHPVGLLFWETPEGRLLVVDEFMMDNASVDDLMRQKIMPALTEDYDRCMITWATGDPMGLTEGEGLGVSPYDVLKDDPFYLPMEAPPLDNRIDPRLNSLRRAMRTLDGRGQPVFGVSSKCKYLIDALENTYVYEAIRGTDSVKDTPTKSHVNWVSDLADAACYATLYRIGSFVGTAEKKNFPKRQRRPIC